MLRVDPPRLARSVCLQMLALAGAALIAGRPWAREKPPSEPAPQPPPRQERRIRVVRLPPAPRSAPAMQAQAAPPPRATPPPPAPKPAARASPAPARIAADSTAVHGVRLRVMVPRSPADLASHLRHSGGCLVVSRLSGGSAEVLSVLGADGREVPGPPCDGVPRVLRDSRLNDALGDPLGRARAESAGELVLQVLLSPVLPDLAHSALRARFGPIPEEEMARRAAESGYELTCFADPAGPLRCQ
jgi:hypothetical protein